MPPNLTPKPLPSLAQCAAALITTLCLLPLAHAARLALVVGNDSYRHVDALKNAVRDAELMQQTLADAGFQVTLQRNLGRQALYDAVDQFQRRVNNGDEVVFFFAGHGVQVASDQVLLPVDIQADDEKKVLREGVPLLYVQEALKGARLALVVVDACRDNPFPKTGGTRSIGDSRGLKPPEAAKGQAVILSAGRGEKALDTVPGQPSARNGLFTWEFAQVLRTPGLDVLTALRRVRDRVEDRAATVGHQQRPSLVDDLRGQIYLAAGPQGPEGRAEPLPQTQPQPQPAAPQLPSAAEVAQAPRLIPVPASGGSEPAALAPALSSAWPLRPIRLVVPFAAGGPTDRVARDFAAAVSKQLKVDVVVENLGGAGGTLGTAKVAQSVPDGYTFLLHHIGMASSASLYRNLPYRTLDDFEYLGLINEIPLTLIARPTMPASSFPELLRWLASNRGKVNLANAGTGSASHLCGLIIDSKLGISATAVPYKGTAPAMTDLLGGQVDLMCDQVTNTAAQIEAGKVKAFAVSTLRRLENSALARVPTLDESGLRDFQMTVWHGLYAPKGTPGPVLAAMSRALIAALRDPVFMRATQDLGALVIDDGRQSPADHKRFVEREIGRWGAMIRAAGQFVD